MPGGVWVGGRAAGGGAACASSPQGCGRARVGLRGVGRGGWGAARLSLCLPCTGTKAGFVGVVRVMEGSVSILLRFVSVCLLPVAARGGRHGAAWSPGGQPVGQAGSLEAPQPLEGLFPSKHACVSRLAGVTGRQGGEGKGACGAWTRLCAWRGSQGREGGGAASQPVVFRGPILLGGPHRVAAFCWFVRGRGGRLRCARVVRSPCPPLLRFAAVQLVWRRRMPGRGVPSAVLEGRDPPWPGLCGTGAWAWTRGHCAGGCSAPHPLFAPSVSSRGGARAQARRIRARRGGGSRLLASGMGRQGGLACPTSRLARLLVAEGPRELFSPGRPGVCGRWVRFTRLVVSAWVSVAPRARAPRAAGTRHIPRYPPSPARGRRGPPRPGRGAPSACPGVRATRGGGLLRPWGSLPAGRTTLGCWPVPPPPVLSRFSPGVRAALRRASAVAVARRSLCHLRRRPGRWVTAEGGCERQGGCVCTGSEGHGLSGGGKVPLAPPAGAACCGGVAGRGRVIWRVLRRCLAWGAPPVSGSRRPGVRGRWGRRPGLPHHRPWA